MGSREIYLILSNYLHNRKQRATINGKESGWKPIFSGVPQGSLLGPLLFLLYINDLADDLGCNPKLFADDVSLNEHIRNTTYSTTCLSRDLNKSGSWGYQWKMLFNPDPAKPANEVVFSNREDVNLPNLCFGDNMIRWLNS